MTNETDPADLESAAVDETLPPDIDDDPLPQVALKSDKWLVRNAEFDFVNGERPRIEYGLEMQRRLKVVTERLTTELVLFRESAGSAAGRSEAAARRSEESAARLERLTRWLIGFTVALVALTLAVLALTAVLAAKQ